MSSKRTVSYEIDVDERLVGVASVDTPLRRDMTAGN